MILMADLAYPVSCAGLGHFSTDGKALPFEFKCLLYPAYGSPAAHPPPTRQPPIDSIRVITAVEKNHLKNQGHTNS